ncbi:MAG: hypoxanthine phosphoribosyltransferase [Clostridia bacterium]|nr:hypoxanthine phosphoribosyltransferase [Clostridia bacterium]
MYDDLEYIMISKASIESKIKEIAGVLDEEYRDKNPVMICILKGCAPFFTDLIRAMTIPVQIDFMAISSYGAGSTTSGQVKMNKDLDKSIEDRHVIIVEDIMDSGYTLSYLRNMLSSRKPASIKICALLDKPSRREVDITPDYKGFEISNEFVVGYGLDYAEKYRNLPEIGVLKREIYEK